VEYGRSLGWKERTLLLHQRTLRELQQYLACHRGKWPEPRLQDLDDFLKAAAKRWKRATVAGAACTFRAWLRFLFVTGRSKQTWPSRWRCRHRFVMHGRRVRCRGASYGNFVMASTRELLSAAGTWRQYLLFCAYGLSKRGGDQPEA